MCSTNNGSDDGGGGEGSYGLSSTSKKPPKRQRVPKRGPGVAELEKILREQEKISSSNSSSSAHIPFFHHMSRPHIDGHFLRMPSISSPLASMSTTNPSSYSSSFGTSTTTPVPNSNYGSANGSTINVENALVRRCIDGDLLPEREFFRVAWAAVEGKSEEGGTPLPSRPVTKTKQHCEDPTSMVRRGGKL